MYVTHTITTTNTITTITICLHRLHQLRGVTPLHAAASHFSADYASMIILLLHAGASVRALDAVGRTPLQLCTK